MPNTKTTAAPTTASLWTIGADGLGEGKPIVWNMPLAEAQDVYRTLVAQGADPRTLRITPAGQRPDRLGYRR